MSRRSGIQLCYPFEESRLSKWQAPFIIQPKLDGIRCRAVCSADGVVTLLSSEENLIQSVPHIVAALQRVLELNQITAPIEFDGELYRHGMDFQTICSIALRDSLHPQFEELEFHIFDLVADAPQIDRLLTLSAMLFPRDEITGCLRKVKIGVVRTLDEIMSTLQEYHTDGYEGIVVREPTAPYVRKRSTQVMKFKPRKSDVYEIIGWQEEISKDGEPKGTLGSLICRSPSSEPIARPNGEWNCWCGDSRADYFAVGSGFNQNDRRLLWEARASLLGQFVEVRYQHITSGRQVPRFPVFARIVRL